jgi:hypothetical protein
MTTDPGVIAAARELIEDLHQQAKAEDSAAAVCWVTVCRDEMSGALSVFGLYTDEATAVADAARFQQDVNRGASPGEPGWTVVAVPVLEH